MVFCREIALGRADGLKREGERGFDVAASQLVGTVLSQALLPKYRHELPGGLPYDDSCNNLRVSSSMGLFGVLFILMFACYCKGAQKGQQCVVP